jgi:hypothetical protein
MSEDDRIYYSRRAEEEISRAQASEDERLVRFHYILGGLYLDRVYGVPESPRLSQAPGLDSLHLREPARKRML